MKVSSLIGFSLSTCLLVFLVAADTSEDIMDLTFENLTANATIIPPPSLGFAAYSVDTGNLLFTSSIAADDPQVMKEIGGAGNYIVVRTQDQYWCSHLTLDECRKNIHFVSETTFSIKETNQPVFLEPPEADLQDTPTIEVNETPGDIMPEAIEGDTVVVPTISEIVGSDMEMSLPKESTQDIYPVKENLSSKEESTPPGTVELVVEQVIDPFQDLAGDSTENIPESSGSLTPLELPIIDNTSSSNIPSGDVAQN